MAVVMKAAMEAAMIAVITGSLRLPLQNQSCSVLYADLSRHI